MAECRVPLGLLMDGQRHAFLRVPLHKPAAADEAADGACRNADGTQSAISFTLQYLE